MLQEGHGNRQSYNCILKSYCPEEKSSSYKFVDV